MKVWHILGSALMLMMMGAVDLGDLFGVRAVVLKLMIAVLSE